MCVMVFGALAPTVAQAMVAASEKGQWVEICSASGMVWLKVDGADTAATAVVTEQDKPMADMGKHCPWCSFHGSAAGLPPVMSSAPLLAPAAQALPEPGHRALCSNAPRCAQARAPPLAA